MFLYGTLLTSGKFVGRFICKSCARGKGGQISPPKIPFCTCSLVTLPRHATENQQTKSFWYIPGIPGGNGPMGLFKVHDVIPTWKISAHRKHAGKLRYDDEENREYFRNPKYDCRGRIHPMFYNGQGTRRFWIF